MTTPQHPAVRALTAFARRVRDDYDHDPDTREHREGYGGICRACDAEQALAAVEAIPAVSVDDVARAIGPIPSVVDGVVVYKTMDRDRARAVFRKLGLEPEEGDDA